MQRYLDPVELRRIFVHDGLSEASRAEVLLSAIAVIRLQASALTKVRQVGWKPIVLLPGFTSGISTILKPSGADAYFGQLYTTGFVKMPSDPQ